jgi:hypothetical protein
MKTTLLFLSVFLSASLFGQEERGYLVIENKGKTACFFDRDDPFSFINLYRNKYRNLHFTYENKIYPELDKFEETGATYEFMYNFTNEVFIFVKEAKEFSFWFDSISNRWKEEKERYGEEIVNSWKYEEERIFQSWVNTRVGEELRMPNNIFYSTLDDIHTLIIEYEKTDNNISYNTIYFVRDTREYDIPVITGANYFEEKFEHFNNDGRTFWGGGRFELSSKENNDLWKSCRRIALEESGKIVNVADYLLDFQLYDEHYGFNRYSPFALIGKTYIRKTETPIQISSFSGESLKLFNDGKFKSFKDWKDFTINKFSLLKEDEYEFHFHILDNYFDEWEKARYGNGQLVNQWYDFYWWDFTNHTSIQNYGYSIELDFTNNSTSIDISEGSLSFGMKMGDNYLLPLLNINKSKLPKDITLNSFDKFKSKQTELKWAKLLYNQKAGEYIPSGSADMRQKIANIVRTPRGFVSGNSDLSDVFNELLEAE